jgi:methanogenic corrinoid protein MtbC1
MSTLDPPTLDPGLAALAERLTTQTAAIAEAVVSRQYALQPGVWERFGAAGRALSVRDTGYHLPYLTTAIATDEPEVFARYVGWVRTLFLNLSFGEDHIRVTFTCLRDVIRELLPGEAGEVAARFAEAGIRELERPVRPVETFLAEDGRPLRPLARMYLDALLRSDRQVASRLVLDSVERGADLREVYLHVLQDVQREVGRLWMTRQITVAREHYCTAVTQNVIARLYPRIMATPKHGRRILLACAGGERHEVGARMVADFFELGGWDAIYLGGDTPPTAVADAVREHAPDVLGISASMAFNLLSVRDVVTAARAAEARGRLKVLVGGYQFNAHPGLWQKTGADAWAPDGREAVSVADLLVA